jgi:hypothetical protein
MEENGDFDEAEQIRHSGNSRNFQPAEKDSQICRQNKEGC